MCMIITEYDQPISDTTGPEPLRAPPLWFWASKYGVMLYTLGVMLNIEYICIFESKPCLKVSRSLPTSISIPTFGIPKMTWVNAFIVHTTNASEQSTEG